MQVIIRGIRVIEAKIGNHITNGGGGAPVKQIGGCCECLSPILGRHRGMDEEGSH